MTRSRPSPPAERSLTSPIWILGHLVALAAIVGFVMLGAWQLRRHDERRTLDERITDRIASAALPVEQLIAEYGDDGDALDLRPAIATGTYLLDEEVILQARTLNGRSGNEVLTPLDLGDGTGLIVDRGWVPLDVSGPPVAGAEPPPAEVTVTGYLRPTQVRGRFGPSTRPPAISTRSPGSTSTGSSVSSTSTCSASTSYWPSRTLPKWESSLSRSRHPSRVAALLT